MIEFAIVSPSFNNACWMMCHVNSVLSQTYPHWRLYYIDDASEDGTGELIDRFAAREDVQGRFRVIHNKTRKNSLANFYSVLHEIEPNHVVVCLDGDDFLAHPKVLERLASFYQEQNIWLTYGGISSASSLHEIRMFPYSQKVMEERAFRKVPFCASHLKSFYARLFQCIKKEDLLISGDFFPVCGDLAFMLPMLEMATKEHVRFVDEVLYKYNMENLICDYKVNCELVKYTTEYIRSLPSYESLSRLF